MKTLITFLIASILLCFLGFGTGCASNSVPKAALTTASIAGGDWVEYSSPKSTEITIENASITQEGIVTISGLAIKAQPDEATVNETSAVDQKLYDMLGAQSDTMSAALSALINRASPIDLVEDKSEDTE